MLTEPVVCQTKSKSSGAGSKPHYLPRVLVPELIREWEKEREERKNEKKRLVQERKRERVIERERDREEKKVEKVRIRFLISNIHDIDVLHDHDVSLVRNVTVKRKKQRKKGTELNDKQRKYE